MQTEALQKEKQKESPCSIFRVCFLCTGNTCRSPMAAAVYNDLYKNEPKRAVSAGIAAQTGTPIHPYAVQALRNAGIVNTPQNDYEGHLSQPLTRELADRCDRLICLTSRHAMAVLCAFPDCASKLSVLGEIADPFGGELSDYERALREITEALRRE